MTQPARSRRARVLSFVLPTAALCWVAGCSTPIPESPDRAVAPPVAGAFRHASPVDAAASVAPRAEPGAWWTAFGDPALNDLVARADRESARVRIAAARLAQARAALHTADAARAPQLSVNAAANRQGGPLVNAAGTDGTLFSLGAALGYEVDLSRRLASARDAAELDALARDGQLQTLRLTVQAEVVHAWLELRAADAERALVSRSLESLRESVRLTERRLQSGLGAELDVERSRAELATLEAEARALDRRRDLVEHALATLAGETPATFAIAPDAWAGRVPSIPAGVPSTVLARRADVAAARAELEAAHARLGGASRAWIPNVALTATGGQASSELSALLRSSARAWGLGLLLALPVLDGGRREAAVVAASAEVDAAAAAYRERLLIALREVDDQLAALRTLGDETAARQRAVLSADRAREMLESRWRNGLVSQLELLDAQRTEMRARRLAVQARFARAQAAVGLVRALGGGWDAAPATVAAR